MPLTKATFQRRGYLSRAGYAKLDAILRQCAILYNASLEEWRNGHRRAWTADDDIPVDDDGQTRVGCYSWTGSDWEWVKKGNVLPSDALLFRRTGDVVHQQKPPITLYGQQRHLTAIRKDDDFWGSLHVDIPRGVLARRQRASQAFYKRVKEGQKPGYPRFKSWQRFRTIDLREVSPGMVKERRDKEGNLKVYMVRVKGLPPIIVNKGAELPASDNLRALRITRSGRRVTVSLTYAVEREPMPFNPASVGIDMGVSNRLVLSNGKRYSRRPNKWREKLQKRQRRLSACKKQSREWRKKQRVLANAWSREKVSNRNECHRITSEIVRDYGHIAVEDLAIRNMTGSAKGTVASPGVNVKAKSGLTREILDQTWGVILHQLKYKAEWAGRRVDAVDPRFTSQKCSKCGVVDAGNRKRERFCCVSCGAEFDADVNAARNILSLSLAGKSPPRGRDDPPRPAREPA